MFVIYINSTNGCRIDVDQDDFDFLSNYNWSVSGGYAVASINGKSVPMHRLILNAPEDKQVDHINRDSLDNRRSNLRLCSKTENLKNRSKSSKNKSSKYKGTSLEKKTGNWIVEIKNNKERYYLGSFKDEESAANCYNFYAKKYHGEFAALNEVKHMNKEEWLKNKCLTFSSSSYKGLSRRDDMNAWLVSIWDRNIKTTKYIGVYTNEIAGANAYNYFSKKIHGENGTINYIDKKDLMSIEECEKYKLTLENRTKRGWKKNE